jgi:hypothetical protein
MQIQFVAMELSRINAFPLAEDGPRCGPYKKSPEDSHLNFLCELCVSLREISILNCVLALMV